MLFRLLLLTKSFRRSLLNYFISKVVHDLFSFRREFLSNVPRLRRSGHKTTSFKKFDLKFDFPVPYFLYSKKIWKLDHDFMHF